MYVYVMIDFTEPSEGFLNQRTIFVNESRTYIVSLGIQDDNTALEPDEKFTLSLVYNKTFTLDTTIISIKDDGDSKYNYNFATQNLCCIYRLATSTCICQ